jgi:hypothetical protein
VHTDIIIPDKLFSNTKKTKEGDTGDGILDVFDRYNFTVKEDEPLEKEVAIDPELLGKSYEKFNAIRPDNFDEFRRALKSGRKGEENKFNKKFGVYYTPREIVYYMCQQSLINYLNSELNSESSSYQKLGDSQFDMFGNKAKKGQLDLTIEHKAGVSIRKEDIETLIHTGEQFGENEARVISEGRETKTYSYKLPESVRKHAALIDQKLADITVCDPAVGSGAFPVGMMSEIVKARNVLTPFLSLRGAQATKQSQFDDNRTVYNFKRQCIERSLYGVDIDPGAVEIAKLRLWLSLVVDEQDINNIKPLPNLDYKIVCGNSLLGVEKDLFNQQLFNELEKLKPLYFNETNPTKKQAYRTQIDDLISQITNGHTEFDFEVYFSEVFHEKGGFDVMIANPPYIGESGHKELFHKTKKGPLEKFYTGKMDYFYFFLHQALNLAGHKGVITYITTNYYITATGAVKLRTDLKRRSTIIQIINFNELKIFESASGQHNMITILSKNKDETAKAKCCITKHKGTATPDVLLSIMNWNDQQTEYVNVSQKDLYESEDNYIRYSSNAKEGYQKTIQNILIKIKLKSVLLGTICNINQGIVTGANFLTEAKAIKYNINNAETGDGIFLLRNNELDRLNLSLKEKRIIEPIFKNSDINKYYTNMNNKLNIINLRYTDRPNIEEYPNIKTHLIRYKNLLIDRPRTGTLESAFGNGFWYVLTTSRKLNFDGPKIVCPYRSKTNTFGYNEAPWYGITDIYFITKKNEYDLSLLYILSLLNSKLYYLWLYYKGKRKGEILELFQKPLSDVPLKSISKSEQKPFIKVVDQIFTIIKNDDYLQNHQKQAKLKSLEAEIDQLVYRLYNLTPEEIKVVEGEYENAG